MFVDETWAKTNMTRLRGWAPRGRPLVDKVPHGHWRTLTFLAALRCDRIDAPLVLDGPINSLTFTACVEQFLLPTLAPGDIVVMDNLGSHKGKAVRQLIRSVGATRPTSTRSSRSSPSSKPCCAKPPRARSKPPGGKSAPSSTPSPQTNAPTISAIAATLHVEWIRL